MLRETGDDSDYQRYLAGLEAAYLTACWVALGTAYRVLPDDFDPYEVDCADCTAAELGMCELAR